MDGTNQVFLAKNEFSGCFLPSDFQCMDQTAFSFVESTSYQKKWQIVHCKISGLYNVRYPVAGYETRRPATSGIFRAFPFL